MKHVQRRHFFVRDMVESFEIEVPFVRTDDNIADFFTKPLDAKKFHAMRKLIMNEPTPSHGEDDAASLVAFLFRGDHRCRRRTGERPPERCRGLAPPLAAPADTHALALSSGERLPFDVVAFLGGLPAGTSHP